MNKDIVLIKEPNQHEKKKIIQEKGYDNVIGAHDANSGMWRTLAALLPHVITIKLFFSPFNKWSVYYLEVYISQRAIMWLNFPLGCLLYLGMYRPSKRYSITWNRAANKKMSHSHLKRFPLDNALPRIGGDSAGVPGATLPPLADDPCDVQLCKNKKRNRGSTQSEH